MTEKEYMEIEKEYVKSKNGCLNPILMLSVVTIVFAAVVLLSSCATKTKIEYRDRVVDNYITNVVHDTVKHIQKDSVWVEIVTKKDTVFYTKYKERVEYRDNIVERIDTVWKEKIVTETVEKVVEKTKIPNLFWISFVFSIIVIIFASLKIVKWLRTKLA